MVFEPLSLLILKFRGRGVAVFRDRCPDYDVSRPHSLFLTVCHLTGQQSVIAVARRNFPPLQLQSLLQMPMIPSSWHQSQVIPTRARSNSPRTSGRLRRHRRSLRDHCSSIWCVLNGQGPVFSWLLTSLVFPALSEMPASPADSECSSTVVSSASNNARPAIDRPDSCRGQPKSSFFSPGPKVRKPVIYLYPPSRLPDVIVELLLTSSWSFSAYILAPDYHNIRTKIKSRHNP
jgi:hypothetical protein